MRYLVLFCSAILLSVTPAFAEFGDVAGSWESRGHWNGAGELGVVCEQRKKDKAPYKVKVYQRSGQLYQEFSEMRFWPESCNISTEMLQKKWGHIGRIVEDTAFSADYTAEKHTLRRWFIE